MCEILATVIRRDRVSGRAGDSAQSGSCAWRAITDATFDETPRRLDWIEVVRVRRQPFDRGAPLLNEELDLRRFMRGEVIEDHDVASPQPGGQPAAGLH